MKPSNIRFDEEGILKILDFGISIHADGDVVTQNGKGTLPYLAPELFSLPATYSESVDIYSFGVMAHQLAFGALSSALKTKPPQSGGLVPEPFSKSPLAIPAEIAINLDRTLSVTPQNRPSAVELKTLLSRRLSFGLHRAAVTYQGNTTIINSSNKSISLAYPGCTVSIAYDGLIFKIVKVGGNVDINNMKAQLNQELPASCVLTLNGIDSKRQFITVDMSHPGLIL